MDRGRLLRALVAFLGVTVGLVAAAGAKSLDGVAMVLKEPAGSGLPPLGVAAVLVALAGVLVAARVGRRVG